MTEASNWIAQNFWWTLIVLCVLWALVSAVGKHF